MLFQRYNLRLTQTLGWSSITKGGSDARNEKPL